MGLEHHFHFTTSHNYYVKNRSQETNLCYAIMETLVSLHITIVWSLLANCTVYYPMEGSYMNAVIISRGM